MKKDFFILSIVLLAFSQLILGQSDNQQCLKCHGSITYNVLSKDSSQHKKMLMCKERRIDSNAYTKATHGKFSCTDCHDEGYKNYPHAGELKNTEMLNCLDCHAGKKKFKKFHFESISSEALKSVHFKNIKMFLKASIQIF